MVMSKGLHGTDVFFMHACNWTVYWTGVSGVGSMGGVRANATIHLSEAPREAPLYMSHILFTVLKFRVCSIGRVLRTPLFQLIVVMKELE